MTRVLTVLCVMFCLSAGLAAEPKPIELGRTKFKELAKHLSLTPEQQAKIRPSVERIQDLVKRSAHLPGSGWRGGYAGGSRVGGPGDWGRRPPSSASGTGVMEAREQRGEWQKEIEGRVLEIKALLTPAQVTKFDTVVVPNLVTASGG